MSIDNVQALPLGTQLGDYRLDAVIGHGGFGITYRAFDGQLAKIVAIKEYLPIEFAVRRGSDVVPRGARFAEDFAWGRERFLDEARALARFRHHHIVPVLRFLEANGTAYTVMEFEDGRSVGELLRKPGARLPADDVRRLAEGLLSGLGAVHAQGFLHRDIKPSNVIIRRDGVPILIDFGAARLAIGGRTQTLTSILTPQYAPIEQYALDGRQGPWSDIYSAAAVLHHAVAGEPPPEAASRVHGDPYRPLAKTQADRFDLPFLAAIDKALAFAPDQRPQTVQDWRALFGVSLPFAHDAPTQRMAAQSATPRLGGVDRDKDERLPPLWTPPRRRGGLAIAIALLLVVLLGLAVWRFQPELSQAVTPAPAVLPPQANAAPPPPAPTATPTPLPTPRRPHLHRRSPRRRWRRRRWSTRRSVPPSTPARCSTRRRKRPPPRAPWRAKRASRPPARRARASRMRRGSRQTTARAMSARRATTASARGSALPRPRTAIARPANGKTMC
jgi:serine/threonine protein kinase